MAKKLLLVAILLLLVLPSALALNCTKYRGDSRDLCNNINPLDISESEKRALMQSNVYGSINPQNNSVDLHLNLKNESAITLGGIYESKILIIIKFVLFILFLYIFYRILIKSKFIKHG